MIACCIVRSRAPSSTYFVVSPVLYAKVASALVPIRKAASLPQPNFNFGFLPHAVHLDANTQTEDRQPHAVMSQFRSKRLDLGGFINARVVRDHTKRKVFEQYEPERYVAIFPLRR